MLKNQHKCAKKGCNVLIDKRFRYCYQHKDTIYIDHCRVHGDVKHQNNRCLTCEKMKIPIFRIHKRKGKYYHNKSKKPLPNDFFMKPYYKILMHPNRRYQSRFIGKVTSGPGTYGIFLKDNRNRLGIGKCLYVGQSTNVQRRINEHKDLINFARKDLRKKKKTKNIYLLDKSKLKVAWRYYCMAQYPNSDLKFVKLQYVDKRFWSKLNKEDAQTCLSYLEQLAMDSFKPQLNVVAARNSSFRSSPKKH